MISSSSSSSIHFKDLWLKLLEQPGHLFVCMIRNTCKFVHAKKKQKNFRSKNINTDLCMKGLWARFMNRFVRTRR